MKILHVLTQKPNATGSGFYMRALLKQATRHGHQTAAVFGMQDDDLVDLANAYPLKFQTEKLPFPIVGMSDVMPYPSTRWSDMTDTMLDSYRTQFQALLKQAVGDFNPDVIHCHHLWVLSALTRQLFPAHRVVASCHGTGLRQHSKVPKLANTIINSLGQLDHIYCLTEAQLNSLKVFDTQATVVGAGFDSEIFNSKKTNRAKEFRILYAGKLSASKGCLELLQAVEPLLSDRVSLSLAGSGHGDESELIQQRSRALGVSLLGRLNQAELADEMRRSDLFVLPSYYEGLPLVLAEALSCGCRVVVTSLPGVNQWLPSDVLASGWVKTIPLPRLEQADQPVPEDIPQFVEVLRQALEEQIQSQRTEPAGLKEFLEGNSWRGVYQRISSHYPLGSDS